MAKATLKRSGSDQPSANKIPSREKVVVEFPGSASQVTYLADFLQDVIDASASNIAILDESRRIVLVNDSWRSFADEIGLSDEKHGVGKKYPEVCRKTVFSSKETDGIAAGLRQILERRSTEFQMEFCCEAFSEPVWMLIHAAPLRHGAPDGSLAIMICQDNISSTKDSFETLENTEEFLRSFFEPASVLPWEADAKRHSFTHVGVSKTDTLGYLADEWLKPAFWISHIHPKDRRSIAAEYTRLLRTENRFQLEYRMIAKDGHIVWIHDMITVQRQCGKPVSVRGFMIDVSERKQSEETLNVLGGRLIAAQEEERRRIARELHDDLNQKIALISIELEQLGLNMGTSAAGLVDRVIGLQKKTEEISGDIHRISYELHSSKLEHLGLAAAINGFCKDLSQSRRLTIDFRDDRTPVELAKNIKLCVYRVAQEALQNAVKYSGASRIEVTLKKSAAALKLVVTDNGCGFDTASDAMTRGLGFISMKERLFLVSGKLRVISKRSHGTRIEATVPL